MAKELKNDIKFAISLDEDQKEAKRLIINNEIVIITGPAGTGKSAVCAQACLDLLFRGQLDKVSICRPTVEVGKTLGFLPGDLNDKYIEYTRALIDNMHECYPHKEKLEKTIEQKIEFYPLQFIRGKTIRNRELVILEEAQNTSKAEMEAIMTRIGPGGKLIINGDLRQKDGKFEGLDFAIDISNHIEGVKYIQLTKNHRSGLVADILNYIYGIPEENMSRTGL